MITPRLILASASPRRRQLLLEAGFDFEVHPADVDEDDYPPTTLPADLAQQLAGAKARVVAEKFPNDVVLGADTVVAFGDQILGKPIDAADARRMLQLLAGTTHVVITGVAVVARKMNLTRSTRVFSIVRMRGLTAAQIDRYIASNDWQGKAGGYGIQDQNLSEPDSYIMRMSGSYSNIVGLPFDETVELLRQANIIQTRQPQPVNA